MSHLSRHQNKDLIKKLIFFLVGIILIGILVFQIGLKSIINTTLFINSAISGNDAGESSQSDEDFFGTLRIYEPPNATNSAEIIISGEVSEYDKLQFYINNTKVDEKKAKESFEEQIGKLKSGENKVYVVALSANGKNKKESEHFTVYYKNEPPSLEIGTPKDGDTVSKQEIQIEGKTDPNVSVSVNAQPVVVDYQGNFKKTFRLKEGENKLVFKAEDEAGNTKETTLTIRFVRDE